MATEDRTASCIAGAAAALKTFHAPDLKQYVVDVYNKAQEYTELKGQPKAAIERAIAEVNDERAQQFMEQLQRSVSNKAKIARGEADIETNDARVLDILVHRYRNLGNNVESAQRDAYKVLMDSFFNVLTPEETRFIASPNNSMEFAKALDGKPASDVAKGLAVKYQHYLETRTSEEVNAGSLLLANINKDRKGLKALHDRAKMLRAGRNLVESATKLFKYDTQESKSIWREFIKKEIDLEATFRDSDARDISETDPTVVKLNMEKVDNILNGIFDDIITEKALTIGEGDPQRMFFYWKDNESWMRYNQQYGHGTLQAAMMRDIQGASGRIGMANILGSNSKAAYNALVNKELEVNPQSEKVKRAALKTYNWLAGTNRAPVAPTLNSFFAALRGLSGTAKLAGRLTLVSLPDIAHSIMFAHRHGVSYFEAVGTHLTGLFNALPTQERKYIAGLYKELTDSHLGMLTRYIDSNNPGGIINKMNTMLYRITLMDALDKGNKVSSMLLMSRLLGDNAKFNFAAQTVHGKRLLSKFNISEAEWEGLRKKTVTLNGKKLITTDSVNNLTDEEVRHIYGVDTNTPLYQLRTDLHRKVYSMFDVASENSVLTPGAFMKASVHIGKDYHPIVGEILKSVLQFKMYGLEYADRVLYQGFKEADGIQNKLKFAGLLFGTTLPMTYLVSYLDNLSQGKSAPDWNKMSFSEKVEYSASLLLPGLGTLDAFLKEKNQNANMLAAYVSTPATRMLGNSMVAALSLIEGYGGGDPKAKKRFQKAVKNIATSVVPGQGLPFVSPYMRQMFGEKPYLQPGQQQLYGA